VMMTAVASTTALVTITTTTPVTPSASAMVYDVSEVSRSTVFSVGIPESSK
jgi:hypothetical protein